MMPVPAWFPPIAWSTPLGLEELRFQRHLLPDRPGVYVFTNYQGALEHNTGVLYVGKAEKQTLRKRVPSYLVDPANVRIMSRTHPQRTSSSLRHAGKASLLVEIQQRSRNPGVASGIWVRWCATPDAAKLEKQLLNYLKPAFNTQGIGADADDD